MHIYFILYYEKDSLKTAKNWAFFCAFLAVFWIGYIGFDLEAMKKVVPAAGTCLKDINMADS